MRTMTVKALCVLTLLLQVWIGVGRGQDVCVPLHEAGACAGHSTDGADGDGHEADHGTCCLSADGAGHERVCDSGACCCVHVPAPSPEQLPKKGTEWRAVTLAPVVVQRVVEAVVWGGLDGADGDAGPGPAPDGGLWAQVCAVKSTRLLI